MAGPRRTLTHLASQIDWSMPPIRNTRSHSRMEEWGRWGAPGVELWGIEGEWHNSTFRRVYTGTARRNSFAALSTVAKSSLGSAIGDGVSGDGFGGGREHGCHRNGRGCEAAHFE
ncbi:hypothetical protein BD779DRAFT_1477053 [Infundibulicybe gibba]|nr:hypothetical protein BD779DRAFT_1477053 [Infundibulicybe gibba]